MKESKIYIIQSLQNEALLHMIFSNTLTFQTVKFSKYKLSESSESEVEISDRTYSKKDVDSLNNYCHNHMTCYIHHNISVYHRMKAYNYKHSQHKCITQDESLQL